MAFVLDNCDPTHDTWISQAEFWARTRRLVHFLRVGLMFIDLDTYKIPALAGLCPEAQLHKLLELCENVGVPTPSLVVYSGRGLQAKWLLDAPLPARALPRWTLVQRELARRLEPLGADLCALDASRVLRLVDTVNSRSGQLVRQVYCTGVRLNFDALADRLLPFTRAQLEQLREARAANDGQWSARDHHQSRVTVGNCNSRTNLQKFSGAQLAWDRLGDIRTLAKLRGWQHGAPDGSRDLAVFTSACFLAQAIPSVPRFYDELGTLAREFAPQWSPARVRAATSGVVSRIKMLNAGKAVEFRGAHVDPRYRWRNDTLIQRFSITPDEERQLRTIISGQEARRRDADRKAVARAAEREATGGLTRAAYESQAAERRATGARLHAQGMSWAEVAVAVGYRNAESARKAIA